MASAVAEKSYKQENFFVRFGRGFLKFFTHGIPHFFAKTLPGFFVKLFVGIKNFFVNFVKRFKNGSVGTKLSHLIMGAGSLYHGQIVKGIIYLALQILFILFLVLCPTVTGPNNVQVPMGYKALINLQLGGFESSGEEWVPGARPNDSSILFLLLGLVAAGYDDTG